jgi:hypothetical protein
MKYISSLLLLFSLAWGSPLSAQNVIIDEDFSDGDFTNNPTWTDTESKHIVNGSNLLQLDAPSNTDEAVITTPSSAAYGTWEAYVELDFDPSSSNLSRYYIVSDSQDMKGNLNGYYIQVGDTENEVSLYRQDGNSSTKIIDGTDDLVASAPVTVRIRATRDLDGTWELLTDASGGTSFTSQGTITDNTYSNSDYIGFFSDYTSTRSDLFQYDDITVTKVTPPLDVQSANVVDNQSIDVAFNLDIDASSVSASDFSINNGIGNPSSTSLPSSNVVRLNYNSPLPSDRYTVTINNVDDTDGNTIDSNTQTSFTLFGTLAEGDVIINEIMKDPPSGQEEYIELKNTTSKILNLQNWELGDDGGTSIISSGNVVLEADSFLVVSPDTATLSDDYGNRAYVEMGGLASFNNGGDVVQLNTGSGTQVDSLQYTGDWGGENVALERRSPTTSAAFQENWGNSPNPLGGTPGLINEIAEDTTPPDLENLIVASNQTLELAFSERLKNTTATNTANYSLSNGIGISSAQQTVGDSVQLSLSSALQNGTSYQLSIQNQQDIFGNTAANADTSFTYFEISAADSGDIFVNEFTYQPSPGNTEYVELYNPTSKSFNLQGWTLSDNRGNRDVITNSQFIVPPDSFAVIAPDNTLLSSNPDINLVVMSDLPALNNSGDNIVIRKGDGVLLDSLQYTDQWGGDEVALERRSVNASGVFMENWANSPNGIGTPGSANEVAGDDTPPFFAELFAPDSTTLQLVFSENITSASATDMQNYQISPSIGIQLISANDDSVTLSLSSPMTSGETYEVTASNISDIFGNVLSGATRGTEFLKIEGAQPRDIVINEILYNPGSGGKADFVELYNASNKNINLSNWLIGDASNQTTLNQNTQLRSGNYIVLTGSRIFASNTQNAIEVDDFPSLNNSTSDDVYIRTDEGRTIDSLRYSQSWGGSAEGTSLERKDPQAASNDPSNWQTSEATGGSSAGAQNISFQEDTDPPEVIFSKVLPSGNIEVRFSEFIDLTNNVQFSTGGQTLSVAQFDSTNANVIILSGGQSGSGGSNTITAQNLTDVKGNTNASSQIAIAQPLALSDVVINEIMFNPLDEPDDNRADQSEYLELRNTQDYAISLEGLFLHDAPDEDGNIRELVPVSTTAKWIPPNEEVLIYADESTTFGDSNIANFFEIQAPNLQSVIRVDRSSLSLASSDDAIFLADSTGATIDSVFYDETWHNPNIIDTRGVALERISPGGPSDNESNWSSSVNSKGGTPNEQNSIYQQNTQQSNNVGLSFTPNPFSPDNDGYEDNLFINYNLNHPDYLIDVQIFDRYGRPVRELADGKQAGLNGQLIWDGRKDDGSRNRIGIYIVVFEAYDSASGKDKSFKKTVVLARKLN